MGGYKLKKQINHASGEQKLSETLYITSPAQNCRPGSLLVSIPITRHSAKVVCGNILHPRDRSCYKPVNRLPTTGLLEGGCLTLQLSEEKGMFSISQVCLLFEDYACLRVLHFKVIVKEEKLSLFILKNSLRSD